jgi:TatD DNase family protein
LDESGARFPSFVDSHCHLDSPQFAGDLDSVIQRAEAGGTRLIVCPGTNLASSRAALALADRYPCVFAAVGVHPNECNGFDDDVLGALQEMARHAKVVAVGEIGLDYYWNRVPKEQQKRALRAQLSLAAELDLPVILHSRESNADLLCEIAQWRAEIRAESEASDSAGVWHAFSGDLRDAEMAYGLGLMLGLGGPVTFRNARLLHALAPELRRDRMLLETDAPYLTPHPFRGQRNEPAHVPLIAEAVAGLCGLSVDALARQTTENAQYCFRGLGQR